MKSLRARNLFLLLLVAASRLPAAMLVTLQTSSPSPVPLGTAVTWTAVVSGASAGTLTYRFQVQGPNGVSRTVVDYGPKAMLTWTTIDREGAYQVEVGVLNTNTFESSAAMDVFYFSPLVSGPTPVVTPSANPMVFIYSAPACSPSQQMRVQFQTPTGSIQYTPYQDCLPGVS